MKKASIHITLLFLLTMFLTTGIGCLKDISDELPTNDPKITVNGFFTPNESMIAFITRSRGTVEVVTEDYLNDAKAYIYENDILVDSLIGIQNYAHLSAQQYMPQIGKTYRIDVAMPGFKSVSASSALPDYVPIQSIQLDTVFYAPSGHNTYVLRIKINDIGSSTDYYHLLVFRNKLSPMGDWNIESLCFESDDIAFESVSKQMCTGGMFSDVSFNGQQKEIVLNTKRRLNQNLNDSVQFVVELRHGSEPYYKYNKSLMVFKNNQWDIFTQPASVIGNVENGYGIFGGYAATIDTVKLN